MVLHNYILHQMTENQLTDIVRHVVSLLTNLPNDGQVMECAMDISVCPMDEWYISSQNPPAHSEP